MGAGEGVFTQGSGDVEESKRHIASEREDTGGWDHVRKEELLLSSG